MSGPISALVYGASQEVIADVRAALARRSAYVETVADGRRGMALCRRCHFDIVILAGAAEALGWWEEARGAGLVSRAVLIVERADAALLLQALRLGVEDVFEAPLDGRALAARISERPGRGRRAPRESAQGDIPDLIGESPAMRNLRSLVHRIAPLPAPVLIEGESGTGKATVARMIHGLGGRPGPFVALDCGDMAPELLNTELFGQPQGAVSGVRPEWEGLVVAADSGTLLIQSIGDLPPAAQGKLVRILDTGRIRTAGGEGSIPVDVRIVATTRDDPRGRVREDLFHALSVIHVTLPPLRERGADILRLAEYFGAAAAARAGIAPPVLDPAARNALLAHGWPGNVRELKTAIERSTFVGQAPGGERRVPARVEADEQTGYPPDWTLEEVKIDHMRRVVEACDGNKSEAARRLAVSRKTLDRKLPTE